MRSTTGLIMAAAFVAAACAQPEAKKEAEAPAMEWTAIATAEEFAEKVVGREQTSGDGRSAMIHADGTATGEFNGVAYTGTWSFLEGKYCREGMLGERKFEYDCQIAEMSGNQIRFVRSDGSLSPTYTVK